jgi:alpha-1,2-mannosyltransferase
VAWRTSGAWGRVDQDTSASTARHRRWRWFGALAFALAVTQQVLDLLDDRWMIDLAVYRWGGDLALSGDQLYQASFNGHLLFTYTPFAAVTFMPLALVPGSVVELLSVAVGIAAIVAVAWMALGALGPVPASKRAGLALLVSAVALQLEPVRETLAFGQINMVLMALVVGDLCLPARSRWKGVGIGVATGLKLTPAIFIVYLLGTRRVPAALRAMAAAAGTVAIGFAVLPTESRQFWIDRAFLESERVGGVAYVANQSIHGTLIRWTGGVAGAEAAWWVLAALIGTSGLALAAWLGRHRSDLAGVLVCALTGLLVSPVSWSHHWVWVVPALAIGVAVALRRPLTWVVVVPATALFLGVPSKGLIWSVPHTGDQELDWTLGQALVGNLYVVAGLAALAGVAVLVARRSRRPQREGATGASMRAEETLEATS